MRSRAFAFHRHMPVGKPHVVELDPSRSLRLPLHLRRLNLRFGVQQFEHPLGGGHRRLQNVELLAQVLNRTEEALRVLMNATSTPSLVTPASTPCPPYQSTQAMAIDDNASTTG